MTFTAEIRVGKVIWSDREAVRKHVAGLEGKRVSISIDVRRPRRSDSQNAYYWGVLIPLLAEFCGYDKEEMHEALKQRLLRTHADSPLPSVRSTSTMNTKDFSEYVENCRRLAAEMGVVVPDPQ